MSEIFRHITESPEENDVLQSDKNTLKYLEACNKLFERGFLSHDRILDMNRGPLMKVFNFFSTGVTKFYLMVNHHVFF